VIALFVRVNPTDTGPLTPITRLADFLQTSTVAVSVMVTAYVFPVDEGGMTGSVQLKTMFGNDS
jgi:hypothetical protein